jgi:hypothetical protein
MERLLYLLPPRPQPLLVRYGFAALLTACSVAVFAAMMVESGFIGLFILLPSIFAVGLMFDRGSGFFATALTVAGVLWLLRTDWSAVYALPILIFTFIGLAFAAFAELLRRRWRRPLHPIGQKRFCSKKSLTEPRTISRC